MPKGRKGGDPFDGLSVSDRIAQAQSKIRVASGHIVSLIQTNANNRYLNYTPRFVVSFKDTYSAHALNDLQRSSFGMELIRLSALWDSAKLDRISLPTIGALIANGPVIEELRHQHRASWAELDDPRILDEAELSAAELAHVHRTFAAAHDLWVRKSFDRNLKWALNGVRAVTHSGRWQSIKGHRDLFLAHNLEPTALDRPGEPFRAPKYGQERRLLLTTQRVANALSVVITNSAFAYTGSQSFARKNADRFWSSLRVDNPE